MYDMYPDWGPSTDTVPEWAVRPEPKEASRQALDAAFNGAVPSAPWDGDDSAPEDN